MFEPAPVPVGDDALRALGVIAIQSARLEWFLVGLHALCDKSKTHQEHLREGRAAEHGKAIIRLVEPYSSVPPIKESIWWVNEAVRLLGKRGDLMHSGWVTDDADAVLQTFHMRTGERRPFDQAEMDDLAYRLGVHVASGPAHWFFITFISMTEGAT